MAIRTAGWPGIKKYWEQATHDFPAGLPVKERLLKEIEQKYSATNRHYHNLGHIQALLELSDNYRHQLQNKTVVDLAIFYHDIIYKVLRKDNEQRSAVLAVKRLKELGADAGTASLVKSFIECTQTHWVPANIPFKNDLEFFLDFDMSILAAHWEDYLLYTQAVRKEYRIYPGKMYRAGRTKFLQHCLQSGFIFHTTVFRDHFEAKARQNIERELG